MELNGKKIEYTKYDNKLNLSKKEGIFIQFSIKGNELGFGPVAIILNDENILETVDITIIKFID